MAGKRDKPEDIVLKLRQIEVLHGQGMAIADAVRQIGVTEPTYSRWRKQYGGMNREQLKRLKEFEAENQRWSCRECCGNCRAAGSGHVTLAPVRPQRHGTSARERLRKRFPSVDLSHLDLTGSQQCPEQHWNGLGAGQHGLTDLFILRGPPEFIRSDNGAKFIARKVQGWIGAVGAKSAFIEPGSPWENGYCESFNSKLRDELLRS